MTPPDLARHTPVPNVVHPVIVCIGPHFRDNSRFPAFNGLDSLFGEGFCTHKPLLGQVRLNHRLAPVTMAHTVSIGHDFDQQPFLFKCFDHGVAALKSIQSFKAAGFSGHVSVVTDDFHTGQVVACTDFKVIGIMGRGNLQTAGTKRHVDIGVFDNGNLSVHQRQYNRIGFNIQITLVIRVDRHRGITQHGFRPGGCHHDCAGSVFIRIADMI